MHHRTIVTSWPIRTKLLLLLRILFLLAAGIIVASGLDHGRHEIETTGSNALLLVQSLAAQQEQIVLPTRQMLSILAILPEVQRLDANAFNELLRELSNRYPFYSTIAAQHRTGTFSPPRHPSNLAVLIPQTGNILRMQ